MRSLGIWVAVLVSALSFPASGFANNACYALFEAKVTAQIPPRLRIATFNLEHLQLTSSNHDLAFHLESPERQREITKNKQIKTVLGEINADILVLTEVANPDALKQLINRLPAKHSRFMIEGNDHRGSHIAMVIKNDLPFEVLYETHRNIKWRDPTTGMVAPVFVRDAPAMILRRTGQSQPFLIVVGAHSKSQRDRDHDPRSELQRSGEFEAYLSVIRNYQRKYGDRVPILLAGDFNTDVVRSPEMKILTQELHSAFDLADVATPIKERTTHTFHPRSKSEEHPVPAVHHQIDDIMMPSYMRENVLEMHVHRYKDDRGYILPFAQSFKDREEQPSDHLPLVLELSTNGM